MINRVAFPSFKKLTAPKNIVIAKALKQSFRGLSTVSNEVKSHDYNASVDDIKKINEAYNGTLEIKERKDFGRGLFAQKKFKPGDLIISSKALKVSPVKDSHTLQKGWNDHVTMDLPAILINHHCSANVGIQDNSKGAFDFFALQNISLGEELFLDYESAESKIEGFPCSCGSTKCRKSLKGFEHHGEIVKKQYGEDFIASYLKN